jgi:cell division protein FtsB
LIAGFFSAPPRVCYPRRMTGLRARIAVGVPLAVLAATLVAVPAMVLGPEGVPRHRRLRAQLEAQRQENTRLSRELSRLRAEHDAFLHDPRARERAVREELGWVRPDEVIVEVPSRSHGAGNVAAR